jgi:hypothetical protein
VAGYEEQLYAEWLGQKAPIVHGPSHEPLEVFALGDDSDAVGADGKSAGTVKLGPTQSPGDP